MIVSLAAIAALAIVGLIVMGLSQRLPSQEQQRQNQHQPAAQSHSGDQRVASEKENQASGWTKIKQTIERNEKVVTALSTAVIAAFTIALVLATGFLYFSSEKVADAAKESADIASRTLVAANRPWISADTEIASDLTFGAPAAAQLTFKFTLKNTGNTPGVSVEIRPKLTILELGVSDVGPPANYSQPVQTVPEKALMDLCQTARIFGDAVFPDRPITGDAIFPGATLSHRVTMQLSKDEIEKARASSYHKVLNLMLLVCVNYKSPLEKVLRQTGYIFFVATNDPAHPNGIDPDKGNISISNLGLTRTFSSSFAD